MNPGKTLKVGQKLYVLMPGNVIKDIMPANTAENTGISLPKAADYSFTIAEEDTTAPTMQWFSGPSLTSGSLTLYFSEAVQFGGRPAELIDYYNAAKGQRSDGLTRDRLYSQVIDYNADFETSR